MDYHRANGVNVRIVRIFNTYGPRMHPYDGRVISNFIRQALEGEDITIFGDGRQTRSFCYRDDLVEGLIRMMNAPDDFCGPVNLGNPEEFTIRELADIVIELTGAGSKLVARPLPADDPTHAGPTLRSPNSGSAGGRRFPCARAWPRRSSGSARSTLPSTARRRPIIEAANQRGGGGNHGSAYVDDPAAPHLFARISRQRVGCVERIEEKMVGCARSRSLENTSSCSGAIRVTHQVFRAPPTLRCPA